MNRPMSQDNDTICPSAQFCNVSIQTMFGRILPKCNITKGTKLVGLRQICLYNKSIASRLECYASIMLAYLVDISYNSLKIDQYSLIKQQSVENANSNRALNALYIAP